MKKQTLSIGFADLDGFGPLIAAVGMEQAIEYLQDGFKAVGDAILKHRGRIHKYLGDGLLFTFAEARPAEAAAREIVQYRRPVGSLTVRFYVAIATGEVFVRPIGHPSQRVEDIMGEPVNRVFGLIRKAKESEAGIVVVNE